MRFLGDGSDRRGEPHSGDGDGGHHDRNVFHGGVGGGTDPRRRRDATIARGPIQHPE